MIISSCNLSSKYSQLPVSFLITTNSNYCYLCVHRCGAIHWKPIACHILNKDDSPSPYINSKYLLGMG